MGIETRAMAPIGSAENQPVRPDGGKPTTCSPEPDADTALTHFSYLPMQQEIPLILTSHFGKFRVSLPTDDSPLRLTSRIAFSCHAATLTDPSDLDPPTTQRSGQDFWACRTTFAINIRTGQTHRLIWGLNARGALIAFAKPEIALTDTGPDLSPLLLPMDQKTFQKLTSKAPATKRMNSLLSISCSADLGRATRTLNAMG